MATKIMIIRHAEKPSDDGKIRGVDENGSPDPDELSVQGWQRAGALIRFFAPLNQSFTHPALATPDVIFACAPSGHATSVRSQHTVTPLAEFLKQSVNLQYDKNDEKKLVRAVTAAQGVALIAWEHNMIPEIVADIADNDSICPKKWDDSRFDLVWVLDSQPNESWKFTQVPQMVLAGDQAEIAHGH